MAHDSQVRIAGGWNEGHPDQGFRHPEHVSCPGRLMTRKDPPGRIGIYGGQLDPSHPFLPVTDHNSRIEITKRWSGPVDHDHSPPIEALEAPPVEGHLVVRSRLRDLSLARGKECFEDMNHVGGPGHDLLSGDGLPG